MYCEIHLAPFSTIGIYNGRSLGFALTGENFAGDVVSVWEGEYYLNVSHLAQL